MLQVKKYYKKIFLLTFFWALGGHFLFSQVTDSIPKKVKTDSIEIQKVGEENIKNFFKRNDTISKEVKTDSIDTQKVSKEDIKKDITAYQKIIRFLKKKKITKNLINSVFANSPQPQKNIALPKEPAYDYTPFQGKIIRKIHITTLDPFGFNEKNLEIKPTQKMEIYGNALHNKTSRKTVLRELLFHEKTPLDSSLLKESERILREKKQIRRVLIRPVETQSDSVDVQVNVLDSWTMFFTADLSDKRGWLRISEQNLFGLGHEISLLYRQYFKKFQDNGKGVYYRAKNIGNTQIDAVTSYYTDDYQNEFSKRLAFERPLFSPYTRWTARVGAYENQYKDDIFYQDSIYFPFIKTRTYDLYGGYVFGIKKQSSGELRNVIFSLRYKKTDFAKKPADFLNTDNYYGDENLFLSKINLNSLNFVRDRYIFRQGDIEDVSVGHSIFFTSGILNKNKLIFPYFGVGFSYANYKSKGYFSTNVEIGTLLLENATKQTTFRGESIYFSNLFTLGNWHFRQFAKSTFVIGLNRSNHIKDRITLNEREGILGFNSPIYGTRKLVFSTQTQAYSPFYWLGFRFNPFFNVDVGFIGLEKQPFFKTDVFSKVALGFYISNDYLMFQNFQFSLCYYPRIPSDGNHILKITNHQNDDFRLQSFSHRLPELIIYR